MPKEYIRQVMIIGSIPRLGQVIVFDDMEDLIKWTKDGNTGDFDVTKDTGKAYNGDASLKIETRATSPADGDWCLAERFCYLQIGKRYSIEFLFMTLNTTNVQYVEFDGRWQDGATFHDPYIRYDAQANKWQYRDSAQAWQDIPGGSQNLASNCWHRVKLVVDRDLKQYISFNCNALEVNLAGISYYSLPSALTEAFDPRIRLENNGAAQAILYVDDVLIRAE